MVNITVTGTLILTGAVDWSSMTIGGDPVILDEDYDGMAPVPVPPPNTGDPCSCSPPGAVELAMTPGTHTVNNVPIVVMGSLYTQSDGSKICQPMMAMSTEKVINNGPVCTTSSVSMFVGMINGAGAM